MAMPRKLQPCGTYAAYARHRYNNEEPCEACRAANMERANNSPSGNNHWGAMADKALEANPPVIVWRFDPVRRIQVAVSIDDPHTERPQSLERRRLQTQYYEQKKAAS